MKKIDAFIIYSDANQAQQTVNELKKSDTINNI